MIKFKFETGEIIECYDEALANALRQDKRYTELKKTEVDNTDKRNKKKTEVDNTDKNSELTEGDNVDGKVQE